MASATKQIPPSGSGPNFLGQLKGTANQPQVPIWVCLLFRVNITVSVCLKKTNNSVESMNQTSSGGRRGHLFVGGWFARKPSSKKERQATTGLFLLKHPAKRNLT